MTSTPAKTAIRRPHRRTAALAACALSGSLLLATTAIGATPALAATAAPGTTLRIADSSVDSLNPFLGILGGSDDIYAAVYPTLTTLTPQGNPAPYLATSWTSSADKLTWTFKIRSGLKWSDGVPITAADVAWTFNLIMSNSTAATADGSLVSNFASVSAPNATTLVIRTKTPQANLLYVSVPTNGIPIVPEHIWKSHVAGLANYQNDTFPLVGYGPWQMTAYQTDQYAKFDANKDFVLGAPKFDHLIFEYFKSTDAAVAALRSGQLDYITGLDPIQYTALERDKSMQTIQEAGSTWYGLELNAGARTINGKPIGTGNPVLADPTVRTAIAMAINKSELVTKVLDGTGQVAQGYLPPAWPQWSWSPSPADTVDFNIAKANQMLNAAGYKMGPGGVRIDPKTGKPLVLRLGIHADAASDTQVSTYLSGWLQQIGIQVTIQAMSDTMLDDNLAKGDWDMLMDYWSSSADPTYLLSIQECAALPPANGNGGDTDSFYCDPAYDKLFDEQLTVFDPAARAKVIDQMQAMLYKANSDIMLYYPDALDAANKDTVTNLFTGAPGPTGLYPEQMDFWNALEATPVVHKGGSSSTVLVGFGGAAAVAVLVGIGVAVRRRSSAGERE